MRAKKIISFVLALNMAAITFTSCGQKIQDNEAILKSRETEETTTTTVPEEVEPEPNEVTTAPEKEVVANEIKYVKYSKSYQAEKAKLAGKAKLGVERDGYKGDGYVTGISNQTDWELSAEIKTTQYYNVTLTIASDKEVMNTLDINGESVGKFATTGSGKFETVTFENIFLEKGNAIITLTIDDSDFDLDLVKIEASKEVSELKLALKNSPLVNKNSDYATKAVYKYICDNFGKKIILGQHDTVGSATETNKIFEVAGKYPAIRFGDLMTLTQDDSPLGEAEIALSKSWSEKGGIVGYMWHWTDPVNKEEYYSKDTDFDLSKAVTKEDIAKLSIEDIKALNKDGKVSDECVAIVEDIDKISAKLQELQEAEIPVLWRPLHEASNGSFWWGKDVDSYKWLWTLLYQRQTQYHKLNNLIWVWSAQNASWYVGDDMCDILSVDIYEPGKLSKQINSLLFLYKISATKPVVMSECGSLPVIQNIVDEKAMWAYIGQWGGNYLLNEDGTINEENNTTANITELYNNNLTITREKLPDFVKIAKKLKEDEEDAQKDKADKEKAEDKKDDSSKSDSSGEEEKETKKTTTTAKDE